MQKFGLNLNELAELLGLTICGLGARNLLRNHVKLDSGSFSMLNTD